MQSEYLLLGEHAKGLLDRWRSVYQLILNVGVSAQAPNGHTPGVSVEQVNERVDISLSAIARLSGASPAQIGLLGTRAQAIKASLDNLESVFTPIETNLGPYTGGTATDRSGTLSLSLQAPDRPNLNWDLGQPLATIAGQASALLDVLPQVALVVGEPKVEIFAGLVADAEKSLSGAAEAQKEVEEVRDKSNKLLEETEALKGQASSTATAIADVAAAASQQKASVDANAAEVEQKLARVREVSKDADTLQQRVTAFSAQFDAFEAAMKARLEQFSEFEAATKVAKAANEDREKTIQGLIDRADTMIRGATTAGLSLSLDTAKQDYEARLKEAEKYFMYSVFALLVCSLPIAAQLIPGPWQAWMLPVQTGAAESASPWLAAIGKLILMLPATWATAFFANNYAELFHLSREYAHKAALARAIDGFKREAPAYEQEIVGSVFMEIQDNPRSRKAPEAATPQNPITKKFLETVLEAISKRKEPKA